MAETTAVSPLSSPVYDTDDERFSLVPELSAEIAKLDEELDNVGRPSPVLDASSFSTKEMNYHMELRNIKPTGFWADDIAHLQKILNQEFAERTAEIEAQKQEIRKRREHVIEEARQRLQGVRERDEERRAVSKNLEARFWMKIFSDHPQEAPRDMRIDVDPPLARVIAKLLDGSLMNSTQIPIVTLDLSNSNVGDASGERIAFALEKNETLRKLEMENSNVGHRTAMAFGKVLPKNNVLRYLSLESNLLLDEEGGLDGFSSLISGAVDSPVLEHLSIWNTGLHQHAGQVLCDLLEKESSSLTSLLFGCNDISLADECVIGARMERNRQLREVKEQHEERHLREEVRFRVIRDREEAKKNAMKEEEEWLERRKVERAEERRRVKEEQERARIEAEEAKKQREEERQRKIEEDKARAEAKRKKKKKGKK